MIESATELSAENWMLALNYGSFRYMTIKIQNE